MKRYILVFIWCCSFNFLDFSRPPKFDALVTEHNNENHTLIFTAIFNYFTTNMSTRIKSRGFPNATSLPYSWNDMLLAVTISSKHPIRHVYFMIRSVYYLKQPRNFMKQNTGPAVVQAAKMLCDIYENICFISVRTTSCHSSLCRVKRI